MFRRQDLEQVILDLIERKLKLCFKGCVEVFEVKSPNLCHPCNDQLETIGYELKIWLPRPPKNISWVRYGSEKEFIDFCYEEFLKLHLEAIRMYSINLTYVAKENRC